MNPSENSKKLNTFFNEEYASLKSYVNSRLKASVNREAEDIIQDVALKLFTSADRNSPINNVAGFVYRSIQNRIIDIMRSSKKNKMEYNTHNEAKLNEFAALISDSSKDAYPEQMKKELKSAIINLKPNYKAVIIAIDFEGYTYKELEHDTGIPIGTLMSRRHRAISQLYKTLKPKQEINI